MADFLKRGKSWQARIRFTDANGKTHSVSKSGFKTKKDAQLYASKMQLNKNTYNLEKKAPKLFYQYFWNWYEAYKESSIRDKTAKNYIYVYNVLKKYFPNTYVKDFNRMQYQKFLDMYGQNHSKNTMVKINSLVHACITDAVYDGDMEKDFIPRTNLVFNNKNVQKIEYLNIAEMKKLIDYLITSRDVHFTSKYMILLALFTGMRLGEIQGLKWQDIDFANQTIKIQRSWNANIKQYQPTKNESSNRTITVNKKILAILKELKINNSDAVFIDQYKTIPTSNAVNKTLRASLLKCNIKRNGFHFHSLRHTHVAYLLSQGIDLYIISKRLGHSDISTTSRFYSYLIDEYREASDKKLKQTLSKLF